MASSSALADSKSLMVGSMSAADLAVQFSFVQRDAHVIAGADRAGVADDCRALVIPAHRIAAREHAERAEAFEPAGGAGEPRVSTFDGASATRGEPAIRRFEARADEAKAAPDVARFEPRRAKVMLTGAARDEGGCGPA